jgi:cytochrome c-type biogenesis protein
LFTAGFTTVFVALGVAASLIGANVGSLRHSLTIVGGALLVLFGLLKLGAPLPILRGEHRLVARVPAANDLVRPYVFGVAFGAAWSPCVGPLLGAALTIAAQSQHAARGALLLCAYGLGTGAAFVAATLGVTAAPGLGAALRRLARHLERLAGAVILIAGVALLTGVYTRATDWLQRLAPQLRGL